MVCYVNTTAEVKAECDVCVTSANVYTIVEKYPNDRIYFLPDKFMGINLRNEMPARASRRTSSTGTGPVMFTKNTVGSRSSRSVPSIRTSRS